MFLKTVTRSILNSNIKNYNIISIFSFSTTTKNKNNATSNSLIPLNNFYNTLKEKAGFQGRYRYRQALMGQAGFHLYLCIQKQLDYKKWFQICNSRDVYLSFCLITYLHVWMVCVRLANEGMSGKFVRNRLIEAMYEDIGARMRKLGNINVKVRASTADELNAIFNASFLGYDEGYLSSDDVLAACLWRHLLEMRDIEDFAIFGILCEYVRKNISHFDSLKEVDLLKNGIITIIPLEREKIDHAKEYEKLDDYLKGKLV
jgi:hypothetical protein